MCEEETFDYRSYIVACCTEQLHTIDNEKIEDQVQTEGEWLALQGGMKKIGPGNHQILCELIASHFPKADSGPPTPAQKTCHKALEKRRSYAAELLETPGKERILPSDSSMRSEDTDRTVNSIYSPFREWNGKIGTMRTPGSSGRSGLKNKTNLRMCSPPGSKKNKSFTFPSKFSFKFSHQTIFLSTFQTSLLLQISWKMNLFVITKQLVPTLHKQLFVLLELSSVSLSMEEVNQLHYLSLTQLQQKSRPHRLQKRIV